MQQQWIAVSLCVLALLAGLVLAGGDWREGLDPDEFDAHAESAPPTVSAGLEIVAGDQIGGTDQEYGVAVAVDGDDNVIVFGQTCSVLVDDEEFAFDGNWDVFVAKYSPAGERLWIRQFGGGANSYDSASSVTTDEAGNAYITGSTDGSMGGLASSGAGDVVVMKLDPDGVVLWTQMFGTDYIDQPMDIVVDEDGACYIAGCTGGELVAGVRGEERPGRWHGQDGFLARLDPDGEVDWVRQISVPEAVVFSAINSDEEDNLIAVGWTNGTLGEENFGSADMFIMKYTPGGEQLWVKQYGHDGRDYPKMVTIDADGLCYVLMNVENTADVRPKGVGVYGYYVLQLDTEGNWSEYWPVEVDNALDFTEIIVDGEDGSLWIAGDVSITGYYGGARDVVIVNYDIWGTKLRQEQVSTFWDDSVSGMTMDSQGRIWICGSTIGDMGGEYQGDRTAPGAMAPNAGLPFDAFVLGLEILPVAE